MARTMTAQAPAAPAQPETAPTAPAAPPATREGPPGTLEATSSLVDRMGAAMQSHVAKLLANGISVTEIKSAEAMALSGISLHVNTAVLAFADNKRRKPTA